MSEEACAVFTVPACWIGVWMTRSPLTAALASPPERRMFWLFWPSSGEEIISFSMTIPSGSAI